MRERIELLLPGQSRQDELQFPGGRSAPNPCMFLGERLRDIVRAHRGDYSLVAMVECFW